MKEPNWQLARKRAVLEQRARILQQIRAFFGARGFLEVETPQRIPANAPECHIDGVPSADWFLQTSPELCMKRLLAAGYERLFQICRCWREGERGDFHLPEYSMLEWYHRQSDYLQLMSDCEELLATLVPANTLCWQHSSIDLSRPWPRLTVAEAFDRYALLPLHQALEEQQFDQIMALQIETQLPRQRPLFLYDYPSEQASLARKKPENPAVAERVELYLGGLELANGFSELTDPVEQRTRFAAEEAERRRQNKPPYPSPEPFLTELAALPPSSGIALGIDRLVMLLCDQPRIDEVVSFTPEQL